jgi:hypothetical protein
MTVLAIAALIIILITAAALIIYAGRAADALPALLSTAPWTPVEEDDEDDGPDAGAW